MNDREIENWTDDMLDEYLNPKQSRAEYLEKKWAYEEDYIDYMEER